MYLFIYSNAQFFFQRKIRLLNKKDFDFVFQKPTQVKTHGIILFSRPNQLKFPRIGLVIPKKYIRSAPKRNQIKRYVREIFRLNQHNLLNLDFVLLINSKDISYIKKNDLLKKLKELWNYYYQKHQD